MCCFCGGAAGHQGTWECYFSGAACTLLPASWFSLPPLAALSTLCISKASYDFSDTSTAYGRSGSWERRKVKPEKLHMWEGSWILMEEVLDLHLQRIFLRYQQLWWKSIIPWTEVDTLLFKRPRMTHPCNHVFTRSVHPKQCVVESRKTGNLVLICGQNFLQAQGYVIHHPIESPVVPFFIFWYHTFLVGPYTGEIML